MAAILRFHYTRIDLRMEHTSCLEVFCNYSKAFRSREEMMFENGEALVSGVLATFLVLFSGEPCTLTEYTNL